MSNKMNKKVSYIGKDEEILRAIARAQSEASKRSEDSKETAFDPPGSDHRTDSADRQAMEELKHRLRTTRRWGPDRPLAQLAHAEAELKTRSAALAKLSNAPRKQPDRRLLVHQLVRTVATSSVPTTLAPELRNDVIGLYSSLQSQDGIESILDRLIVAMSNSVMACHARAAETRDPRAIDVNLRGAEKGSKALIGLVEARERRRNPKQFVVEKLNVEQAILANFETPSVRSADESQVEPSLDSDASGSDNEGIGEK